MKPLTTVLALAAMFLTSACADQPTTAKAHLASSDAAVNKQNMVSSQTWEEATAARTAAHVTNNNLIMMR